MSPQPFFFVGSQLWSSSKPSERHGRPRGVSGAAAAEARWNMHGVSVSLPRHLCRFQDDASSGAQYHGGAGRVGSRGAVF